MHSIETCLTQGTLLLKNQQIISARSEAKALMCYTLNISIEKLLLDQDKFLSATDIYKFQSYLNRRAQGEPLAYITQVKEFFGIEFFVNKHVLIPRQDTETLVENIVKNHYDRRYNNLQILELGIGSGCILFSLLKNFPNAEGVGVDLSQAALHVAQKNAAKTNLTHRTKLIQSNWYQNVKGKFDIIVSNPPYVDENDKALLSLGFEPEIALFAKKNGIENYKCISKDAKYFLNNEGSCYVEIGMGAAKQVEAIFQQNSMQLDKTYKDLGQIDRCMKFVVSSKAT